MPSFIKMMQDKLGVADGQRFEVDKFSCYFKNGEFYVEAKDSVRYREFYRVVTGKAEPEQNVMPQNHSTYWYYEKLDDQDGEPSEPYVTSADWTGNDNDLARYLCGNCFLTREIALAHPDTFKKMNEAAMLKLWNNS